MRNLKLNVTVDEFQQSLDRILSNDEIEMTHSVYSEVELTNLIDKVSVWEKEIKVFLDNSFFDPDDYFKDKFKPITFKPSSRNSFRKPTISEKRDYIISNYNQKKDFLFDFGNALPVLDLVVNEKKFNLLNFDNPSEIIYLILKKLKDLKDGEYFRIDLILDGNGVELKNGLQELFEYVEELKKKKWVDFEDKFLGRITINGEIYLEKQYKVFNKKESIAVSKKIDSIIKKLDELGLGQEILFNELEELKGLYLKLNKKNWSQILKGKLLEMSLGKVLDLDALEIISNELLKTNFPKILSQ